MTTISDLVVTVADLIKRRYADRVIVTTATDEIHVLQSGTSKWEVSIQFLGTELPLDVNLRYKPGSRSFAQVTKDGVFTWDGEKLTADGFVYRAFKGWFGGYQRYD